MSNHPARINSSHSCRAGLLSCGLCIILLALLLGEAGRANAQALAPKAHSGLQQSWVVNPQEQWLQSDYDRERQLKIRVLENRERQRLKVKLPATAPMSAQELSVLNAARASGNEADGNVEISPSSGISQNVVIAVLVFGIGCLAFLKWLQSLMENQSWKPSGVNVADVASDRAIALLAEEKSLNKFKATFDKDWRGRYPALAGDSRGNGLSPRYAEGDAFGMGRNLVDALGGLIQKMRLTTDESKLWNMLEEAKNHIQAISVFSERPDMAPLRQLTCAVEILITHISEKVCQINSSTLRTLGSSCDVMRELCQPQINPTLLTDPPIRLMVVDDDIFCRMALSKTLSRSLGQPEDVESPIAAIAMAENASYDLIFLDVLMPDIDGFELCERIHRTAKNQSTAVVFVTSANDFDSRAKSIASGGRDLIAKPFQTFELAAKALSLVARERMRGRGALTVVSEEATPDNSLN